MQFGQTLGTHHAQPGNCMDTLLAIARASEEVGLDSLWVPDHFIFPDLEKTDEEIPIVECFTTMAAVAAVTTRIRIGSYVIGIPYRNPALVAKMFTTLDLISHGRMIVGLGASWHQAEFDAYGWAFPPAKERLDRLTEAIQIIKQMLSHRVSSYSGTYYSTSNAVNTPQPVQRPNPPILVGGAGEQRTLRIVAQYADYCNIIRGDPDTVARKYTVLRQYCEELGRPHTDIVRTNHVTILMARNETQLAAKKRKYRWFLTTPPLIGTPEKIVEDINRFAMAGTQHLIFNLVDAHELESIYLFAETVMPAFSERSI